MSSLDKAYSNPERATYGFGVMLKAYIDTLDFSRQFNDFAFSIVNEDSFRLANVMREKNVYENVIAHAEKVQFFAEDFNLLQLDPESSRYDYDKFQMKLVESFDNLIDTVITQTDLVFENFSIELEQVRQYADVYLDLIKLAFPKLKESVKNASIELSNL